MVSGGFLTSGKINRSDGSNRMIAGRKAHLMPRKRDKSKSLSVVLTGDSARIVRDLHAELARQIGDGGPVPTLAEVARWVIEQYANQNPAP